MLEKLNKNFEYKRLTEDEQKTRGILGRLVGPCADFVNPTRNGRKYSEQLWENVFNNPIMKEKIANKCCFGELNHPVDRTETDMEKIAVCLAEQPKKGRDGKLYGVFDILNTPNGKILKALCDYGCTVGISSRGQGDLITDENGDEAVDPDTYDCECFDVVLVPGVEAARLKYVTESLHKEKTLKQALAESFNQASDEDKKIMTETLNNLNIDINEAKEEEVKAEEVVEAPEAEAVENKEEEKIEETPVEVEAEETVVVAEPEVEAPVEEVPAEEEAVAVEEPVEAPAEEENVESTEETEEEIPEDEKVDIEKFLDFLADNFDEDQVKKVCKVLDLECDFVDDLKDEEEIENKEEVNDEKVDDDINSDKEEAEVAEENAEEAVDDGADVLVNSLKEALKGKSDLENTVKSLQEKLAVSDAKVDEINEECNKYKNAVTRLSMLVKSNKDLKENVSTLEKSLNEKNEIIENQKARISRLVNSRKESIQNSNSLTESVNSKVNEINTLNESLKTSKQEFDAKVQQLTEELQTKETQSNKKINELTESLNKAATLKESYKKLANKAVNKYIEVKADILGLTPTDIKRKLGESYTMEDVDQVCEDLKAYQLNVSRLPFSIDRKVSVKVTESKSNIRTTNKSYEDDDVDDNLIRLAKN